MTILTLVIHHLIPVLRKQKQADIWEGSQPGLHNKSQGLQDYTVKYCLKKMNKTKEPQKTKHKKMQKNAYGLK